MIKSLIFVTHQILRIKCNIRCNTMILHISRNDKSIYSINNRGKSSLLMIILIIEKNTK